MFILPEVPSIKYQVGGSFFVLVYTYWLLQSSFSPCRQLATGPDKMHIASCAPLCIPHCPRTDSAGSGRPSSCVRHVAHLSILGAPSSTSLNLWTECNLGHLYVEFVQLTTFMMCILVWCRCLQRTFVRWTGRPTTSCPTLPRGPGSCASCRPPLPRTGSGPAYSSARARSCSRGTMMR
jgi:hypothetical protein